MRIKEIVYSLRKSLHGKMFYFVFPFFHWCFRFILIVVCRITCSSIHLTIQSLVLFQEQSHDLQDGRRDELSLTTENKGGTVELIVKSTANEGIIRILLEYNKKEKRR